MCTHERCSGQLERERDGRIQAWLVCDDCNATVTYLPEETAEANRQLAHAASRTLTQTATQTAR